jgi:oligoendopeptidase F
MHSFYSNEHQAYHYADYSIFLAETASITSELLLYFYLIKKSSDNNLRAVLVNHILDEFRATVVRQTMFAEFEYIIHRKREGDDTLTADFLEEEYFKLARKYFGEGVICDDLIRHEWARIPHFHYGFYVYKYATGFCAGINFANRIMSGDKKGIADYIKLISSGSRQDVFDIMNECGINPESPEFISGAFNFFKKELYFLEGKNDYRRKEI